MLAGKQVFQQLEEKRAAIREIIRSELMQDIFFVLSSRIPSPTGRRVDVTEQDDGKIRHLLRKLKTGCWTTLGINTF